MKCIKCGKTKKQRDSEPPMRTGIDHPVYFQTKSFYNYPEGHYCPECHRENELRLVMAAMDNYALKHGETKLAKIFLKD